MIDGRLKFIKTCRKLFWKIDFRFDLTIEINITITWRVRKTLIILLPASWNTSQRQLTAKALVELKTTRGLNHLAIASIRYRLGGFLTSKYKL